VSIGVQPSRLEPGIYRFAFHREHPEDTFVHTAQRLTLDEALEAFDAKCELA
jgi:hypothetical protein